MMHVESEHCAYCGKPLVPIYKNMGEDFVGNTFTGMYKSCPCLKQEAPEQGEVKESAESFFDIYFNKNDNVATLTKFAIIEFAELYHKQSQLPTLQPTDYETALKWYMKGVISKVSIESAEVHFKQTFSHLFNPDGTLK